MHTNGSSSENGTAMDAPSTANGTTGPISKKNFNFTKSQSEIIRLIGQYLRSLGLNQSVEKLIQESLCSLENKVAGEFRQHVLDGEWNAAKAALSGLKPLVKEADGLGKNRVNLEFLLMEQKYKELLDEGDVLAAVQCLRAELAVLPDCEDSVHQLTALMMCSGQQEMRSRANWPGKGPESRQEVVDKIQSYLPATVMLPPKRLETLLTHALEFQRLSCDIHNNTVEATPEQMSLLSDHKCSKEDFPSFCTQVLRDHEDEVWFCRFSPDGTMFASGGKDGHLFVYDVDLDTQRLKNRRDLGGHQFGVSYFSFSPDGQHLLSVGPDESADMWLWNPRTGSLRQKLQNNPDDSITCCSWFSDNFRFAVGGTRGQFYIYNLHGQLGDQWEGVRVQCIQCHKTNNSLAYAADSHYRIKLYNLSAQTDTPCIQEEHPIMSFSIDDSGRYCLVNIANMGIHMWDLQDRCLVRRYQGVTQGYYAIHSCFGGVNQDFIASGSEDSLVHVWHRGHEHAVARLRGHSRTVNCVDWNPRVASMLASASDDCTVRVWVPQAKAPPPSHDSDVGSSGDDGVSSV